MVTLLGVDPGKDLDKETRIIGVYVWFSFLETLYNDHVNGDTDVVGDDV